LGIINEFDDYFRVEIFLNLPAIGKKKGHLTAPENEEFLHLCNSYLFN
jgi:hypothetical protein